jgi:cytochrome c biogenesis protein
MTAENQSTGSTETTPKKPRKKAEKKSLLTVINDFLASVTLAISLLIALATTSIIGTVVLQKGQPEQYLSEYGPGVYKFFKFLALDDMYRSWWFLTLLVLLMMNITLCSIRRIPRAWQLMTRSPTLLDDGLFRRMKQRGSVRRGVKPDEAVERAGEVLRSSRRTRIRNP